MSRERLLGALHMSEVKADTLVRNRVSSDGVVLKRTVAHFAGEEVPAPVREFNEHQAGGLDQLFYINQVASLIEAGAVDWDRPKVVEGLRHLHSLLETALVSTA